MDSIKPYSYLFINILSVIGPLLLSFDKKVNYSSHWKYIFPSILVTAIYFIVWDFVFVDKNVWSFNPDYISGIKIYNLPIEECLFFFCIPFSCMFIYVIFRTHLKEDFFKSSFAIYILVSILLVVTALLNINRLYTSITFLSSVFFLAIHFFFFKSKWLGVFFVSYIIHLIPFFVVNGILTSVPIVLYNNDQNLGIRLFTIPIEDTTYSLLLLIMNVTIYEFLIKSKK